MGGNCAGGIDPADAPVLGVGDDQIARGIDRHRLRTIQHGIHRRTAITGITRGAVSGHRRDDSVDRDLTDPGVIQVGKIDIAGGISGHATGMVQHRGGGESIVPGVSYGAVAGNRQDGLR
jgi:hypothetical protein